MKANIIFSLFMAIVIGTIAFTVKNCTSYKDRFTQTEEVDTIKSTINGMGIITGSYPVATGNRIIPKTSDSSLREQLYSRYIKGEPIEWKHPNYSRPIVYSSEEPKPKITNGFFHRHFGDPELEGIKFPGGCYGHKKQRSEFYQEGRINVFDNLYDPLYAEPDSTLSEKLRIKKYEGISKYTGLPFKYEPLVRMATKTDIDSLKAKISALDSAVNYNTESIKMYNEILKRLTNPQ